MFVMLEPIMVPVAMSTMWFPVTMFAIPDMREIDISGSEVAAATSVAPMANSEMPHLIASLEAYFVTQSAPLMRRNMPATKSNISKDAICVYFVGAG